MGCIVSILAVSRVTTTAANELWYGVKRMAARSYTAPNDDVAITSLSLHTRSRTAGEVFRRGLCPARPVEKY